MAIQSQPSRISEPFAGSGTKNVIPATNATPSASQAASWASGFPPECSQPLSAGGCPVPRNDMNGVLNWLSQGFAFKQDGGIWEWSALADYDTQRVVRGSDGVFYYSKAQSGPSIAAGAQDPTADAVQTYWGALQGATPPLDDVSSRLATTQYIFNQRLADEVYMDSVNGDDANDGLAAGTALQTVDGLIAYIGKKLPSSKICTVHLAAGSYDRLLGAPDQSILYSASSGVTINGCTAQGSNVRVVLAGTFASTGSLAALRGGTLQLRETSVAFTGVTDDAAITSSTNGLVYSIANTNLSFSFANCVFSKGTVYSVYNSTVMLTAVSWSGTPTGRHYYVEASSVLSGAGSPTAIPGTTAGYSDSTSYFS